MDFRRQAKHGHAPVPQPGPPPVPQTAHPAAPAYEPPASRPEPPAAAPLPSFPDPAVQTTVSHQIHRTIQTGDQPAEPVPATTAPARQFETGKRLYPVSPNNTPAAIVIHCSDPRFQAAFEEFLEHELGLQKGGYIPIVVGGGAGVLGHPEQLPKEFKFLKERLEHYRQIFPTAKRIILINHEGCRYYQNLKGRALSIIGARLHMPLDLGRDDLSLVAGAFRHFLSHLGYSIEYYYARFADAQHTHIEIEKVTP